MTKKKQVKSKGWHSIMLIARVAQGKGLARGGDELGW